MRITKNHLFTIALLLISNTHSWAGLPVSVDGGKVADTCAYVATSNPQCREYCDFQYGGSAQPTI